MTEKAKAKAKLEIVEPDPAPVDDQVEPTVAEPDAPEPEPEAGPTVAEPDAPDPALAGDEPGPTIAKPSALSLDRFKSVPPSKLANVQTLQTALPHYPISHAKDYVHLHPNEDEYWSPELDFVNVPIKGQKKDTLHLIDSLLAARYLPPAKVLHFRLALASKPNDIFFLAHIPTRNEDNEWNRTNVKACELGKTNWVQATSRKEEGVEAYKIDFAGDPDAFAPPNWPKQTLNELIIITFTGRIIDRADHPGLLRLLGRKQQM